MIITAIVATIGRRIELTALLESMERAEKNGFTIEVIIIDQNQDGFLDEIISKSHKDLNITHIRTSSIGLSKARNIGLASARGDLIFFPDDDSELYPDTLTSAVASFERTHADFVIGRIYDRNSGRNILKNWPITPTHINYKNFFRIASSITIFLKKSAIISFDESMGAGAKYGSCEDLDYIYRILRQKKKGHYIPDISVWHPDADHMETPLHKVESYSSGFSYFCRKHSSPFTYALLCILICKKLAELISSPITKRHQRGYFKSYAKGIIKGLKT